MYAEKFPLMQGGLQLHVQSRTSFVYTGKLLQQNPLTAFG